MHRPPHCTHGRHRRTNALGLGAGRCPGRGAASPAGLCTGPLAGNCRGPGQRPTDPVASTSGTVWTGSAQLVLTGGPGSQDRAALPARLHWRLRPTWGGLRAELRADCCTPTPLLLRLGVHWGGACVALADGQSQRPAAVLTGLGTPGTPCSRKASSCCKPRACRPSGRRPPGSGRQRAARRAGHVLAPVHTQAHGQLPHHPRKGRGGGVATANAAGRPATQWQRPGVASACALPERPAPRPSARAPRPICSTSSGGATARARSSRWVEPEMTPPASLRLPRRAARCPNSHAAGRPCAGSLAWAAGCPCDVGDAQRYG